MSTLVFNAGSSSIKFSLFDREQVEPLASGQIDWGDPQQRADFRIQIRDADAVTSDLELFDPTTAATYVIDALVESGAGPFTATGHRVVHGGTTFHHPVSIDAGVKAEIARLADLAPLHNPSALAVIEAAEAALPDVPHAAVFDTAFFASLPPSAYLLPVPYTWYEVWGVRRFGFHGISHAYCAERASEVLRRDLANLRLVICHLGNGCSATAVRNGVAVATTMGFTPLDGLMMGTRPGAVDPGVLLYVQRHGGLTVDELDEALNHNSGLLGVSGISADFRQVQAAAERGHERAQLALELYANQVRATIGALATTLGGLDALVFTAGVGENAINLRTSVCEGLAFLGMEIDQDRNAACRPDTDLAAATSAIRILVIHTREDLMIARQVEQMVFR